MLELKKSVKFISWKKIDQVKIRWLLFLLLVGIYGILKGQNTNINNSELALQDRWIECDLLWFKPNDIKGSVDKYFSRISPLYGKGDGEKGIVLNPGWMFDMVACWTGNLDDQLILPTFKMPGHQYLPWTG